MFCIPVLQLHVFVLWMQLLLLSGDVETNPGPVCQKCSVDKCICNVKVKPRRRPSKQCPACASPVPCRRMICECGYDFIKCVIGHTPDKASKRIANTNAVAASRANQTPEQSLERKSKNINAMATLRANETAEQSLERKTSDKNARSTSRANETPEQSLECKTSDKNARSTSRANETPEKSLERKTSNKDAWSSSRANQTLEQSLECIKHNQANMRMFREHQSQSLQDKI